MLIAKSVSRPGWVKPNEPFLGHTVNQQVGNPMRERWFVLKDRDTTYMRQLLELGMQDSSLYKPTFSLIQPGNKKCVFKEAD